jgi:type IV secretory pathway TrbL component
VRSTAGTGDQTLIVGFVVSGDGQKQTLIRGIGPTLGQFGVNGALVNPQLKLSNAAGAQINQNDDWGGSTALANAFSRSGAFSLAAGSRDAALLLQLQPGTYTAQVSGVANTTSVALVEVYDMQ